jgi:methylenetetrahydrofolate--tRNA-(uracil-5-)-methyltransferase
MTIMINNHLQIIGGGLAGSEAAWQAAQRGIKVTLYEMRPSTMTEAHQSTNLAELVCSNSLGSMQQDRGTGLLINELIKLDSLLIKTALASKVPAGSALAVDRVKFSETITQMVSEHPNITLKREEIKVIPDGVTLIASGPLTSPALAGSIQEFIGTENLFFYDAIAPIISGESIDQSITFRSSRYDRGDEEEGDYVNCPFTEAEYNNFVRELVSAEKVQIKDFEIDISAGIKAGKGVYFERCLPVEVIAARGEKALAYGPMRPVGLTNPRTGRWPYAVVQLRQEDLTGELFNMVGFQTNLTFPEQKRLFRLIPGLQNAEFHRFGQMHRNTFISSPGILLPTLQTIKREDLFMAGQIIGVEGYAGNIASGYLAGINATRYILGQELVSLPEETMIGAIIHYICNAPPEQFQPMKANFGILPAYQTNKKLQKRQRYILMAERALVKIDQISSGILNA